LISIEQQNFHKSRLLARFPIRFIYL